MQNVIRDLGQFSFFLVDPVLRTLLRSSAPLRFAQDDTMGVLFSQTCRGRRPRRPNF